MNRKRKIKRTNSAEHCGIIQKLGVQNLPNYPITKSWDPAIRANRGFSPALLK
jgi:hypothetical protein